VKQKKAMAAAISGLGAVVVTAIAIGFDLAVVSAGHKHDRVAAAPTVTTAVAPAADWVQVRVPGPRGLHEFTITLHHGHIRLGIG
jgi:hypothetical protein